jgi:hypothetical protein
MIIDFRMLGSVVNGKPLSIISSNSCTHPPAQRRPADRVSNERTW